MKIATQCFLLAFISLWLLQCAGGAKKAPKDITQLTPQERISILTQKIQEEPNNLELRRQLFEDYLTVGLLDQAESVLQDILAVDPNQPDLLFRMGEHFFEKGQSRRGYHYFLQTLETPGGEAYAPSIANYVAGKYLVQQVTTDSADEAFPHFSSDGSKIIYQIWQNGSWDIAEMDLANKEVHVLLSTEADEELPVYAPDGQKIAFTSNAEDRRPIDRNIKSREIMLFDRSSGFVSNLTESIADDWLPRFSHDGKQIVFVSDRADLRQVSYGEKQSDIFLMDAKGNFQRPLTRNDANDGGACFSADDKHIYFHSDRNGTYDIFVMKTDGSQVLTLVDNPDGDDVNPYASPDGQHLVFFSNRDGDYEIYMCRTDGTEQERLTYTPGKDLNPVFSPDGRTIAFHSNRNGNFDIFLINLDMPASQMSSADLIERLKQLTGQ